MANISGSILKTETSFRLVCDLTFLYFITITCLGYMAIRYFILIALHFSHLIHITLRHNINPVTLFSYFPFPRETIMPNLSAAPIFRC